MRVETERQTTVTVNLMGLSMDQARRLRNLLASHRHPSPLKDYYYPGFLSPDLHEVCDALERATRAGDIA